MCKDIFKDDFPSRPLFYLKFREVEPFMSNARIHEYEKNIKHPVGVIDVHLSNYSDA